MKVFKFGGASINTVERIQNAGNILRSFKGEKILVIISAMGKNCVDVCPKGLNPTRAIGKIKELMVRRTV